MDELACEILGHKAWETHELITKHTQPLGRHYSWLTCTRCSHIQGESPGLNVMVTETLIPAVVENIFKPSPLLALLKRK